MRIPPKVRRWDAGRPMPAGRRDAIRPGIGHRSATVRNPIIVCFARSRPRRSLPLSVEWSIRLSITRPTANCQPKSRIIARNQKSFRCSLQKRQSSMMIDELLKKYFFSNLRLIGLVFQLSGSIIPSILPKFYCTVDLSNLPSPTLLCVIPTLFRRCRRLPAPGNNLSADRRASAPAILLWTEWNFGADYIICV